MIGRKTARHATAPVVDAGAAAAEARQQAEQLGARLVRSGRVGEQDLVAALATFNGESITQFGQALAHRGVLDGQAFTDALAAQYGVGTVDLAIVSPEEGAPTLLREADARALLALPLSQDDTSATVVVADPSPSAIARLSGAVGKPVSVVVAPADDLRRAIDNVYRALTKVGAQVAVFEERDAVRREAAQASVTASDDAPVVQVVQLMITQGLRDRASDIHVEPQEDRVRVRYRIDGALHDVLSLPGSIGPAVVSRIKILGGMNIVERRRPQDGQISMEVEGREVDIRVSTASVVGGEKVVMRLLDKSRPLFRLDELGMPPHIADKYAGLIRAPYGMMICAGPTGSGKTTTLYGSLGEINNSERNIMTIEDPVEYTFPSINQISINEQAGVTFAGGLRSILRQDPDIILVGEIRDVETARIAVQSALTGHFVLSSLHATDSVSALHRLLDMGIEGFLVASSVTGVVAQRLVRKVCPHCTEEYEPDSQELAYLSGITPELPTRYVRGAGCNFCAHTGYLERIGVYELLPVNDGIRELVLDHASHDDIRKLARANGMRTLQEEAVRLVAEGITNVPEILRSIYTIGG